LERNVEEASDFHRTIGNPVSVARETRKNKSMATASEALFYRKPAEYALRESKNAPCVLDQSYNTQAGRNDEWRGSRWQLADI